MPCRPCGMLITGPEPRPRTLTPRRRSGFDAFSSIGGPQVSGSASQGVTHGDGARQSSCLRCGAVR